MTNGIKGLRGEVFYAAVRAQRVLVRCEPSDEGARTLDARRALGAVVFDGGVDGEPIPASLVAMAGNAVKEEIRFVLDFNRHLYSTPGVARGRCNARNSGRTLGSTADGYVLRIELELCEPEGLSPDESFEFAERMMLLWTERALERQKPQPAPKPKRVRKSKRKEPPDANRAARALSRLGYMPGCRRPDHLDGRACNGGCVERQDLDAAEMQFAISVGIHAQPAAEIRAQMAHATTLGQRLARQFTQDASRRAHRPGTPCSSCDDTGVIGYGEEWCGCPAGERARFAGRG